jgi:hypothetical protein
MPLCETAIEIHLALAPLPFRIVDGYLIFNLEPRLPSIHSMIQFSPINARLVTKFSTLSDQF